MKKIIPIVALLTLPAVAQASFVINGSFEDYTSVNAGSWSIFGNGHGWTTGNNGVEIRNAVAGSAADGVRFADQPRGAQGHALTWWLQALDSPRTRRALIEDQAGGGF